MRLFKYALFYISFGIVLQSAELKLQNNMNEVHKMMINTRGMQQMREQKIFEKIDKFGISGSNQYLEGILRLKSDYENDNKKSNYDYKSKTSAFLMGTTSNFINYPNVRIGINYGYLKSNIRFDDSLGSKTKVRTHGIGTFIGYNYKEWQIIGKLGYTQSKNKLNVNRNYNIINRNKNYNIGGEVGRYFMLCNNIGIVYPYIGIGYNYYKTRAYEGINSYKDGIYSSDLGLTYYKEINDKFLLTADISWNHEFSARDNYKKDFISIDRMGIDRDGGQYNISLGYFYDPDFLLTIRYQAFFNKNFYYDLVGVGLSHNF
ncbi:autotransporter domain-containing protein [Fusobacterium sp. PH5-44]|uniref:autotransporter domain-containing protein n=1 Tax=unclassified Fusobacterium TaxID=2648384 RepID=UPI003D246E97